MKYEIRIEKGFTLVNASGAANAEGCAATAAAIVSSPGWEPGMNILIAYSDLDLSHATDNDLRSFAQAIAPYRNQLGDGLCACVNTKPAGFGLGRIWGVFMQEYSDLDVAIFYDLDDAKRWLTGGGDH